MNVDLMLPWLNGALVSDLVVIDERGERRTIWTLNDAIEGGLTIEDAINGFVKTERARSRHARSRPRSER